MKVWDKIFNSKVCLVNCESGFDYLTKSINHPLGRLICVSGKAFSSAFTTVFPYLVPIKARGLIIFEQIYKAEDEAIASSPEKVLKLIETITGDNPISDRFIVRKIIEKTCEIEPDIVNSKIYQKLERKLERQQ